MLGKNKKGGWVAIGVAGGTSIAVATKEPVWVAVGVVFGAVVILASTLEISKTEKIKE